MPGQNLNEVGNEGRNDALQNGTVTTDRVLLVHVRVVVLRHHCVMSSLKWATEISRPAAALQPLVKRASFRTLQPGLSECAPLQSRATIGSALLRSNYTGFRGELLPKLTAERTPITRIDTIFRGSDLFARDWRAVNVLSNNGGGSEYSLLNFGSNFVPRFERTGNYHR